jgi:septal ring factor EnvC (AmiA/AmiB activator)
VIEQELEAIAARERAARAGAADQEALAARLLRLQQRQGSPDRLRLALEGKDAATVARHIAYYGYIQRARAGLIGALRRQGEELAALEREARERRDALAANEAEQAAEARRLEKERATRAALATKLAGELERGRREIGRLKRDEARLARLVEELARALAAREAAPRPRGRRVEGVADESVAATAFEKLRGRLKLPVAGEVANRYGGARGEGGTWKGLFIRSPNGETVRAVADGLVVYADWLRGFGNLLILDHGKGYMSLYGHNEGLLRQVGQKVRGGDPIAHVGQAAGEPESGLYFELRREGKTFDPMSWVAQ